MKQLLILLLGGLAQAACLNGHPSVQAEFDQSSYVIVGKVSSKKILPATKGGFFLDGEQTTVLVLNSYKGKAGRLDIFSENSSGRFPLAPGKTYLLFVHRSGGRLVVDNCGNSAEIDKTTAQIKALGRLTQSR